MKKPTLLIALLALIGNSFYAQSDNQNTSPESPEGNRIEATIICLDAIEAPTIYNAFCEQFIQQKSFPKKTTSISLQDFKNEIENWLISNPENINKILAERKKAHDILYGPRPY